MPTVLILALIAYLFLVSLVHKGQCRTIPENRATYVAIAAGFVALAGLGITWAGALFAVLLLNLLRDSQPSTRMGQWYPTLLFVLLYVWVPSRLPAEATVWIAGAIVGLGCLIGVWSWVSWWHWPAGYTWWGLMKPWKIGFWEHGNDLSAGQLNVNHTQGMAIVASAASIGLGFTQSPWWLLTFPLVFSPIHIIEWHDRQLLLRDVSRITQGIIHLLHLLYFGVLPFAFGWWLLWILVPLYVVLVGPLVIYAIKNPLRLDSGRCRMWWVMLLGGWWRQSWMVRLLGQGWGAWWQGHDMMSKVKAQKGTTSELPLWSCAHNDYVQTLLEHGALGFVALMGFLGERLYVTSQHDPTVYLMGIAICSVALLSFPWTLFHETYSPVEEGVMTFGVGSPTLNVITLLIAMLAARS